MTDKRDFWTRPDGKPKGVFGIAREGECSRCGEDSELDAHDLCADCDDDLEWRNEWFRKEPDELAAYLAERPERRKFADSGDAPTSEELTYRLRRIEEKNKAYSHQIRGELRRWVTSIRADIQSIIESLGKAKP